MVNIDDYNEVKDCFYKDEHYSARDNGSIKRHQREGKIKRKLDNVWSFGTPNIVTGYMDFCGERVHRIVATAFHGKAPSEQHVVDHIDTNRHNNRPENLRWLTKLENILTNEITRKKVELICGSVEAFLENPQLLYGYETEDRNFIWMKNVTKEEAQNCLANWSHWAKTAQPNPKYRKAEKHVGDWIFDKVKPTVSKPLLLEDNPFMNKIPDGLGGYRTINHQDSVSIIPEEKEEPDEDIFLYESLTPSAKQRYWRTPTEFPYCPLEVSEEGLKRYMENLKKGVVFSSNVYDKYYVVDKGLKKNSKELVVFTNNGKDEFLSWAISTISIKDGKYIHENTKATAGKELSESLFKYLIGQGELTDDDIIMLDSL
ncbi:MAG: HNH endonuclease [Prevotella sp.]|nr:HNH endonuclease [Prevotella sp.]